MIQLIKCVATFPWLDILSDLCFLCSFNLLIKAYVIEKDDTLGNATQISEIDDLRLLKEKRN